MGLFDQVLDAQQSSVQAVLSPAEAFAAITLAAIASDGHLSEQELNGLITALNRMRLYRSYTGDTMRQMFDKLFGILKHDGVGVLFNAAQDLLPKELQEAAFAVAVDLLMADGQVSPEEKAFLEQLYNTLNIPEEKANKIIEVMAIKNRG
ncbi:MULTISPECIES: tellurite resistance TerB family protein [unclassified Leptolyngbya]|uniref:tellurite resistance TerB family protein n=1 Tax=unclassified Leptolyngbya TaxID=2650499 RepID=UPI001683D1C3|nr:MULTISPECIES: tellurite resistance TerB family protein [unclassified Leptolyngbya]MBD1911482.1 tellurite resistance TerB family protein [Leptolyngbya sp. FACHB-8]MBD2155279.1 tellurite resistance TerB family protein [Leptolyngbya sp. FACHB-16]